MKKQESEKTVHLGRGHITLTMSTASTHVKELLKKVHPQPGPTSWSEMSRLLKGQAD